MATTNAHLFLPQTLPLLSSHSSPFSKKSSINCCASSSPLMETQNSKLLEFPYVSAPHKELMLNLVSSLETRLGSSLLPCHLPPDVQYFENPNGSAQASLHVFSGDQSSLVDFILASWIHCTLPSGGDLNITSLSAYLKPLTDAPNFLIEVIRSSPNSLVLILDLTPRKDLVLFPQYLKTFYEETQLDRHRQLLEKLPEVKPYFSSSLFVRAVTSPTAIMVSIDVKDGETPRMEDIIRDHLTPVAKEMIEVWMNLFSCVKREVGQDERGYLEKRDLLIRNKTIEIDLASSFPRLFGKEVAARVLASLKEVYGNS